jgi:hypothetical protein
MAVLVREREALAPDVLHAVDEQAGARAGPEADARDLPGQRGDDDGHGRVALDRGQQARDRLVDAEAERRPRLAGAFRPEIGVVSGHGRER